MTPMSTCLVVVVLLFVDVGYGLFGNQNCPGETLPLKGGCITSAKITSKLIDDEANDGYHHQLKAAVTKLQYSYANKFNIAVQTGSTLGLSTEETKAIFLYPMDDTPNALYKDFNQAFRDGIDKYPVFHYWLETALDKLGRRFKAGGQLYRGVPMVFTTKVGAKLPLPGFTSFSEDRQIGEMFAQYPGCTLIILAKSNEGVKIADLSSHPHEAEVLIPPSEEFEVIHIDTESKYLTITLRPTGKTFRCRNNAPSKTEL